MAKSKTRPKLVMDLKKGDVILLDRPECELVSIEDAKKEYRMCPKGSKVLRIKDKHTGKEDNIFLLADDKLDMLPRPNIWARIGKWLESNHKTYSAKLKKKDTTFIPPILKVTK